MEALFDSLCCFCGSAAFTESDGFFYCDDCGNQSQQILSEQATYEFDGGGDGGGGGGSQPYLRSLLKTHVPNSSIKPDPAAEYPSFSSAAAVDFEERPYSPADFPGTQPSALEIASDVRTRYLEGVQRMIQLQCEVLVEKFGVSPLICGVVALVWLRFVAFTRVLDENWVNEEIAEAEEAGEKQWGEGDRHLCKNRSTYHPELRTSHGDRIVDVLLTALKKAIPLAYSLAICFLACHISREAILPTDIVRWAIEGELPYLAAFLDIENDLVGSPTIRLVSSRVLFRPTRMVISWELESFAGRIAAQIGLHLCAVNFHGIGRRYLEQLHLPTERILPLACRIFEWSMPSDLWLPAHDRRLPSRVCVLSILAVAIRVLYNINSSPIWEMNLCSKKKRSCNKSDKSTISQDDLDGETSEADAEYSKSIKTTDKAKGLLDSSFSSSETVELLVALEAAYDRMEGRHEYSKDLSTYLEYCSNIVFSKKAQPNTSEEMSWQLDSQSLSQSLLQISMPVQNKKIRGNEESLTAAFWNHYKKHEEVGLSGRFACGCYSIHILAYLSDDWTVLSF